MEGAGSHHHPPAETLRRIGRIAIVATLGVAGAVHASAQELEPGAYTVSPVGVHIVNVGVTFSTGDVAFEPTLPIDDGTGDIGSVSLSYGRAISLAGRSATALATLPVINGTLSGLYLGVPTTVDRTGVGDMRLRLGLNLYGAPARRLPEFVKTSPARTNVSVGLTVVAPTGEYDPALAFNVGTHRWAFKPEVALTRSHQRWTVEAYAGVWIFTTNDNFLNGHTRSQAPLFSSQFFVRHTFKPGLWLSINANFYSGGRTAVDGLPNLDFQKNSRLGGTLVLPVSRRNTLRIASSRGVYTTIGADFYTFSVSYQRAWGGGL